MSTFEDNHPVERVIGKRSLTTIGCPPMLKRYLTGLDWSGDPGDSRKSAKLNQHFVVATCTIDLSDNEALDGCLSKLRERLGVSPQHVFRHADSNVRDRREFFGAIIATPVSVRCICIDKAAWNAEYVKMTKGPERIRRAIADLIPLLDDEWVANQKLLVDMYRGEKGLVELIRRDVRSSLKSHGRATFYKVVPRPDSRADAAVIQVADMFAGEVRAGKGSFSYPSAIDLSIHQ